MPLLEFDRVTHGYGRTPVLRELSFSLQAGEIGCLLGASGCGKTTALRLIAGFETPQAGEIRLDGRVIGSRSVQVPPERRRLGMVFQDYALFPHLSIADNVGFGLRGQDAKARAARVGELLEQVGLAGHGTKKPHQLSGGQQQRVALARALAPRPALLLLDEPFSNLDVALRERLSLEVREVLKASGTAAILVTHDQHEAFAVADVAGLMHDGRIEQWARPYDLYHRPASRRVADFIGQGVFVPGERVGGSEVMIELGRLGADGLGADGLSGGSGDPGDGPGAVGAAATSARLQVLLRPDDVVHDDDSTIRAEVLHRAFRGADFLYTLRLPSGTRVLSLVPSHHDHAIGERIGIRLSVDHVIAFRETGA